MVQEKQLRRIQVPTSPETRAMLQTYADTTGASLARVCEDILTQTAPVMLEMAQALQEAQQAPARAVRNMNTLLEQKLADIDQHKLDLEPTESKKTG